VADVLGRSLILDGHERSALAAVRSLHRAGVHTAVAVWQPGAAAAHSRMCDEQRACPSPRESRQAFKDWIAAETSRTDYASVMCFSDASFRLAWEVCKETQGQWLLLPPASSLETALSKSKTAEFAERVGVPVPATVSVDTLEAAHRAAERLRYPIVAKASWSCQWIDDRMVERSTHYFLTREAFLGQAAELLAQMGELTVQQYVPGESCGYFALAIDGVAIAEFAHRRVYTRPPSGGGSAVRVSVPIEPRLRYASRRLVEELAWSGPLMLEYKRDSRDGSFRLIEVNPRFCGSLPLAISAGVYFPVMVHMALLGHEAQSTRGNGYRIGVVGVNIINFVKSARETVLKRGWVEGIDYPGSRDLLKAILLSLKPGVTYDLLSLRDPGPFVAEARRALRKLRPEGRR